MRQTDNKFWFVSKVHPFLAYFSLSFSLTRIYILLWMVESPYLVSVTPTLFDTGGCLRHLYDGRNEWLAASERDLSRS